MPNISKQACWDALLKELICVSDINAEFEEDTSERLLYVAVVVQAGRDSDMEFINGEDFGLYCKAACLNTSHTKNLLSLCVKASNENDLKTLRKITEI